MRYDGYYILADLVEIPNLRQKATSILGRKMGEWFLGMEMADDPFLPQSRQMFFALYTVAAAIYRWVVAFSICWFLYKLFESYELKVIGQIVVLASLYGLFCQPLYQLGKFFYVPGRLDKVKKTHFYPSLIGLLAILAAFCFVPLPHSVLAPLEIQARDAESIYVVVRRHVRVDRREARPDGEKGPAVGAVAEPRFGIEDRRPSRQGRSLPPASGKSPPASHATIGARWPKFPPSKKPWIRPRSNSG